ncbi:AEC family transporter [Actinomyces capricornis]|uniref:Permease n=1 Tax=Actinomyces capricornis TaxID=2755559 RepID=A0ABN6K575_9ACTO|nr:AEC family transporter [Actinomyces capricornis]BDA64670.1 permease [Actinomyces capricornis]
MAEVLGGLAVFGLAIALGWLLARSGALPRDADSVLTRVCFFAATPALLVLTLSRADLHTAVSATTAAAVAAELIAILTAWLLHRLVLVRSRAEATVAAISSGYVNAANLGIPVTILILGDATPIAPILLLQLLIITPVTFTVLDAATRRGSPSRFATLTAPLRNPLLWAVVAGVVLNLAGWDPSALDGTAQGLARIVSQVLEMLGAVAVPLMMLALGVSLASAPRPLRAGRSVGPQEDGPGAGPAGPGLPHRAGSGRGALWWAVVWKLLVMPALALLLGLALGLGGSELLIPVVVACLPTAQNVFMYASRYGAAKDLARDTILVTTAGFIPVVLVAAAVLG